MLIFKNGINFTLQGGVRLDPQNTLKSKLVLNSTNNLFKRLLK